jgi:hypothetical protein
MTIYVLRGPAQTANEIEADSDGQALEGARAQLARIEPTTRTSWPSVRVFRVGGDGSEEYVDQVCITLDAVVPLCYGVREHEWRSPRELGFGDAGGGVVKHGDGVITTWVCRHCGSELRTDTWAVDGCTGEPGARKVSYREAVRDIWR